MLKSHRACFFLAILLLLTVLFSLAVDAQVAGWNKVYAIENNSFSPGTLIQTSDGGYLIDGTDSLSGLALVKTDANGNEQWRQRIYEGFSNDTVFWGPVTATPDSGCMIPVTLRRLISQTTVGKTIYKYYDPDIPYVLKLDSSGNIILNKTLGLSYAGIDYLIKTSDGGYAMAGYTESDSLGSSGIWLAKYVNYTVMQWKKQLFDSGYPSFLIETADGGLMLSASNSNNYLIKLDASGNLLWNKTSPIVDINSAVKTADGGCAISQQYSIYNSSTYESTYGINLLKIDSLGNMQWNRTYQVNGGQFIRTDDNGFAIVGMVNKNPTVGLLYKTDTTGNIVLSRNYTDGINYNYFKDILQTTDSGYLILAYSYQSNSFSLIKTDANGLSPTLQQPTPTPTPTATPTPTTTANPTPSTPPSPTPTPLFSTPTSTAAPLTPNQTQTPSVTPSPSIPEFPYTILLSALAITAIIVAFLYRRKFYNKAHSTAPVYITIN
jgi:hypothetical protein